MNENKKKIRDSLNDVFRDVFEDGTIEIFDEMTSKDIENWDSLMHITLVIAIEKKFNIRLNAADVGELDNVSKMIDLLCKKVKE